MTRFDVDDGEPGRGQTGPHVLTHTQQGADTPGQSATAQGASSAAGNVADPRRAPSMATRSAGPPSTSPLIAWRNTGHRRTGSPSFDDYGPSFIPPGGVHDLTCAFVCKNPSDCSLEHACAKCEDKARKEGRIK